MIKQPLRYFRSLILLSLAVLLSGCYATKPPLYKFESLSEDVQWQNGDAVVWQSSDSIEIALAFIRHQKRLHFEVEIFNDGQQAIEIEPSDFLMISPDGWEKNALDPAREIERIDTEFSNSQSHSKDTHRADVGFLLLDLFVDIATIGEPESEVNAVVDGIVDLSLGLNHVTRVEEAEKRYQLAGSRDFWEIDALGRTTLKPEGSVRGLIVFSAPLRSGKINIVLPVEGEDFIFPFEVKNINAP